MTTHMKTTKTTTGDHSADPGRPPRDHPVKRLATTANIATAVVPLGASIALGSVMAHPVYKFLVGVAVVVLIAALAGMAYQRYVRTEPTVEEMPAAEVKTTS